MSASPTQAEATASADLDFIARIAAGDRAAETEFVRRYQRGVQVLVRRHCRPGDPIVEDIAQDVLARVLERLRAGAIRDAASLPAYVQTTVVYATSAEYRSRRPTESVDAIAQLPAADSPVNSLTSAQLRQTLTALLAELPLARDRELLTRFYLDDEDKDNVCRDLGIDSAHFRRVAFRARERFRELLDRAGIQEA
jgi:RNA polymerase sigma-70 factor (ECF subfamily)